MHLHEYYRCISLQVYSRLLSIVRGTSRWFWRTFTSCPNFTSRCVWIRRLFGYTRGGIFRITSRSLIATFYCWVSNLSSDCRVYVADKQICHDEYVTYTCSLQIAHDYVCVKNVLNVNILYFLQRMKINTRGLYIYNESLQEIRKETKYFIHELRVILGMMSE